MTYNILVNTHWSNSFVMVKGGGGELVILEKQTVENLRFSNKNKPQIKAECRNPTGHNMYM